MSPWRARRAGRSRGALQAAATFMLLLAIGADPAAAQEQSCGDRASLEVAVWDESGTLPMPGATVVLHWSDVVEMAVRGVAEGDGSFFVCVPQGAREAVLWAELGDDSSEQATLALVPGRAHTVELRMLLTRVRPGRLIGRIYDIQTDRPVATAAVSITVDGREHMTQSNRQGEFILSDLRPGAHELQVGHLGYATLRHPIAVNRGRTTQIDIGLVPAPVEMEPIVATVTRLRRLEIKGFYERKRWGELTGNGYFFTPEYIERWQPSSISTLVTSNVPGITSNLRNRRLSAGFSRRTCAMKYYLDGIELRGMPVPVSPREVAAVEVYKGAASLPAEFAGSDARCGAIVVWTR